MVNTLFNKVLGENEKPVFYFYLKTEGNYGTTPKEAFVLKLQESCKD